MFLLFPPPPPEEKKGRENGKKKLEGGESRNEKQNQPEIGKQVWRSVSIGHTTLHSLPIGNNSGSNLQDVWLGSQVQCNKYQLKAQGGQESFFEHAKTVLQLCSPIRGSYCCLLPWIASLSARWRGTGRLEVARVPPDTTIVWIPLVENRWSTSIQKLRQRFYTEAVDGKCIQLNKILYFLCPHLISFAVVTCCLN